MQSIAMYRNRGGEPLRLIACFKGYAIIEQMTSEYTPFVVAYRPDFSALYLEWAQGHYCECLEAAEKLFMKKIFAMYEEEQEDETE